MHASSLRLKRLATQGDLCRFVSAGEHLPLKLYSGPWTQPRHPQNPAGDLQFSKRQGSKLGTAKICSNLSRYQLMMQGTIYKLQQIPTKFKTTQERQLMQNTYAATKHQAGGKSLGSRSKSSQELLSERGSVFSHPSFEGKRSERRNPISASAHHQHGLVPANICSKETCRFWSAQMKILIL